MIPQRDLSRIANGLLKPRGRRVPEAVIERDYCLGWFLTSWKPLEKRDIRPAEYLAEFTQKPTLRERMLNSVTATIAAKESDSAGYGISACSTR